MAACGSNIKTLTTEEPVGGKCAYGGVRTTVFKDANGNGKVDNGEQVLSSEITCKGNTITENYLIQPVLESLCTEFSAIESCYFLKGQLVKYSDGSILFGGTFRYLNLAPNYTDTDHNTILGIVPPNFNSLALPLSSIARGDGYKPLLLVYNRNPEAVFLVMDKDYSDTYTAGDDVIKSLGLQKIYSNQL